MSTLGTSRKRETITHPNKYVHIVDDFVISKALWLHKIHIQNLIFEQLNTTRISKVPKTASYGVG